MTATVASSSGVDGSRLERIAPHMQRLVDGGHFPGIMTMVYH